MSADDKSVSASRPETTEGAADEYAAEEDAERVKMAKLRELRLAAEPEAAVVAIIIAAVAVGVGEISYRLVEFIN